MLIHKGNKAWLLVCSFVPLSGLGYWGKGQLNQIHYTMDPVSSSGKTPHSTLFFSLPSSKPHTSKNIYPVVLTCFILWISETVAHNHEAFPQFNAYIVRLWCCSVGITNMLFKIGPWAIPPTQHNNITNHNKRPMNNIACTAIFASRGIRTIRFANLLADPSNNRPNPFFDVTHLPVFVPCGGRVGGYR